MLSRLMDVFDFTKHNHNEASMATDVLWRIHPKSMLLAIVVGIFDRQREEIVITAEIEFAQALADPPLVFGNLDLFDA